MDTKMMKKKYEEMPIEMFALFLESYNEEDFMTEAQDVISEVIDSRQNELDEYRKQKADDDLAEEIESIDNGRRISRKVKCKVCDFSGVVEAVDTQKYPPNKIFKLLGKDSEGHIHLKCPSCKTDISFSPFEFFKL